MTGALLVASTAVAFGAPPNATVDRTWFIPATPAEPQQVLVEWHRNELVAPKGGRPTPNVVWRLTLVTGATRYSVLTGATVLSPVEEITLVDVTRDGHLDVVFHDVQGNHGSGPAKAVASVDGRPQAIFASDWSETSWTVRRGVLHVDEPRGGISVCCPSHRLLSQYRWNGRRLAAVHRRLVKA